MFLFVARLRLTNRSKSAPTNCQSAHRSKVSIRDDAIPSSRRFLRGLKRRRGSTRLRVLMLITTAAIVGSGILAYRVATTVSELEMPDTSVPQIANGNFLGMALFDMSRNQVATNPWLRMTMNSGHRGAIPSRRFQMNDIIIKDGQHPETGEAAILVMVTPKFQETPDPPFHPVAIRLWQPPADSHIAQEKVAELQRVRPPREEDLRRLEEVWSGNRVAELSSLVGSLRRLLAFTVVGAALILIAGAYRSLQWLSSKWDSSLVEQQRSRSALQRLKQIRRANDESIASSRRE